MTRILVDKKRGRPHNIRNNIRICRTFFNQASVIEWWGKALAFDALIGNTDRHPDNWGFLFRIQPNQRSEVNMAPLFDNGTSLGYELPDDKLVQIGSRGRIDAYLKKGTHHCGWDGDGPAQHFELCKQFLQAHKGAGAHIKSVIRFDQQKIASLLDECTHFDVGIRFSEVRAKFVSFLLEARRAAIGELLRG